MRAIGAAGGCTALRTVYCLRRTGGPVQQCAVSRYSFLLAHTRALAARPSLYAGPLSTAGALKITRGGADSPRTRPRQTDTALDASAAALTLLSPSEMETRRIERTISPAAHTALALRVRRPLYFKVSASGMPLASIPTATQ